jgi:branched-chain amino acid transport system substrate-binding protein
MPTSYAAEFVDAAHAPYFFITNADYSTAARSAVQYVAQQEGRLGLARNPGGFGIAPIAAMKEEAERLGVPVVAEEDIGYTPTDAVQQSLAFRNAGATHIWMGNTNAAMSVLARDLARQRTEAVLIGNIYAGDEAFIRNAGEDAEGHLALYGSVPYGERSAPAMEHILAANYAYPDTHYIRGWVQALLAAEVIGLAIDEGLEVTGENLRKMFHTLRDFSPGGLVPPVSFFENDHRPSMSVPLYQVRNGEWVKVWDNTLER